LDVREEPIAPQKIPQTGLAMKGGCDSERCAAEVDVDLMMADF
jgi:hypothetical protein